MHIPAVYNRLMSLSIEKENATFVAINALDYIETLDFDTIGTLHGKPGDLESSMDIPSAYSISSVDVTPDNAGVPSRTVTITIPRQMVPEKKILPLQGW